ncbi:alkylmercury lyase family protein [Prauserella muralis]|uniref:Uncharacterized protein n=1 Tax=Prauserella muralis TaxID=588067 RepID=A0A2V4BNB2_9PSEU|nr:alkylmercury lyase family protein [Prauserella muralis]PXY32123.1 hypothetical protein BAY60_07445 [Prauserella muralis]TWE24227.1 alkylmercury lyase-like protein [Prauserella muralis]
MELRILHVPDCPNVELLRQRLRQAADDAAIGVTTRVVTDLIDAEKEGMTGSPTLLVDGADPFAEPGSAPSLSCRLYRDAEGRASGAPSVAALRQVVAGTSSAEGACCAAGADTDDAASALRGVRARAAPADPAERAVHQLILRSFAAHGVAPGRSTLATAAAPSGDRIDDVLARLHERDVIRTDRHGRIRAAYPFSAVPTRHRVRLEGGPEVSAMCMIDALGMPFMLGVDATIATVAPDTHEPITVTVTDGHVACDPARTVVFVGTENAAGPSADVCCDHLNAFPHPDAARAWAAAHPGVAGDILDIHGAARLGAHIFGGLLDPDPGTAAGAGP